MSSQRSPVSSVVAITAPMPSNSPRRIVERRVVLIGRHVARVGVVEHVEHALDAHPQHLLGHGRADEVVGDVLVGLE